MATVVHHTADTVDGAGVGFFIGVTVLLIALALFFLIGLPYLSDTGTTTTNIEMPERFEITPAPITVPEQSPGPAREPITPPEPATLP